jgi:hypothetical protein
MKLRPDETELTGEWRMVGREIEKDLTARRIEKLTQTILKRLGTDPSGWDTLYRDPDDGRLWELTCPDSDSEGGGPPRLAFLEVDAARRKYGAIVGSG